MDVQQIIFWIGLAIGIIEIAARAIPDKKYTGILGHIINGLKFVSDYLNRGKSSNRQELK
jgi:hypothetical protein